MSRPLILASGSPRRSFLLRQAGFVFTTQVPNTNEIVHPYFSPCELVHFLAYQKTKTVARKEPESIVVSSDTMVVLGTRSLGKPATIGEARRMIRSLSGREHYVCTGVCVMCEALGYSQGFVDQSWVRFHKVNDRFINSYFKKINPMDKAGAYAIQGAGAEIIESICGSEDTVMGLPMTPLSKLLHSLIKQ